MAEIEATVPAGAGLGNKRGKLALVLAGSLALSSFGLYYHIGRRNAALQQSSRIHDATERELHARHYTQLVSPQIGAEMLRRCMKHGEIMDEAHLRDGRIFGKCEYLEEFIRQKDFTPNKYEKDEILPASGKAILKPMAKS